MSDEESRAALYRASVARRIAAIRARRASLRGSSSERAALTERWKPLIDSLNSVPRQGTSGAGGSAGGDDR